MEGRAGMKGTVRYGHQGGGQDHTHQIRVICKNKKEMMNKNMLTPRSYPTTQP
jgi:hypothetical protein